MTLRRQISRRIIVYGTVRTATGLPGRFLTRVGAWARVAPGDGGRTFYEVLCRGPSKCGTFVSVRALDACPKCGSPKIVLRSAEAPGKTKI